MILDEVIAHEQELAKEIYIEAMLCHANPDDGKLDDCIERGRYHDQLAEWLEELKCYKNDHGDIVSKVAKIECNKSRFYNCGYTFGYIKAIDDFVMKLKDNLQNNYKHFLRMDSDGFEWLTTDAVETIVMKSKEQLKENIN